MPVNSIGIVTNGQELSNFMSNTIHDSTFKEQVTLRQFYNDSASHLAVGDNSTILRSCDDNLATRAWATVGLPAGINLRGISQTYTGYVVVGAGGNIYTSDLYGYRWTQRTSGTTQNLNSVYGYYNNVVAVGNNGTILTSEDYGVTWTSRASGTTQNLNKVIMLPTGTRIVVGNGGTIITSDFGDDWTVRTSPTANNLRGVSYPYYATPGITRLIIAVGAGGTILTSTDGTTWTSRTSGITTELICCAWGEGVYVVAGAGGVIRTSPDAATWTARTSGVTTTINALSYNNLSPFQYYSGGVYSNSTDAVTWTSRNDHGNTTEIYDIHYNAALPAIDLSRNHWGSTQAIMSSTTYGTPSARNTYYNTIYRYDGVSPGSPGDAYTPGTPDTPITTNIGSVEAIITNFTDNKTLTFDAVMSYNDQTDDTSGFRLLRDGSAIQAFTVAPSGSYSHIFAPMTLGPNSFTRIRWQYTITAGSGTDDQYFRFFKIRLIDLA